VPKQVQATSSALGLWLGGSGFARAGSAALGPKAPNTVDCKHSALDQHGMPWPHQSETIVSITSENRIEREDLAHVGQIMDFTLFHFDKRGWKESWNHLLENKQHFTYLFMTTAMCSGCFQMSCVHCNRLCTLYWEKANADSSQLRDTRNQCVSFLGQTALQTSDFHGQHYYISSGNVIIPILAPGVPCDSAPGSASVSLQTLD
jgi:hypothetical protein